MIGGTGELPTSQVQPSWLAVPLAEGVQYQSSTVSLRPLCSHKKICILKTSISNFLSCFLYLFSYFVLCKNRSNGDLLASSLLALLSFSLEIIEVEDWKEVTQNKIYN